MPYIEIRDGWNKGMVYEIEASKLTIGRDDDETIPIYDQGVSRRHAEIFRVGEMYFIRDLGSRNGTYVNEERIEEELLRVNDRVRVGNTELVFREGPASKDIPDPVMSHDKKLKETSTTIEYRLDHVDPADLDEPEDKNLAGDARRMQILVAAARALAEERNPERLLDTVVRLASEAVDADHGYVFVRSSDKQELAIGARYERGGKKSPTVSTSVIKKVIRESRALLITDAATDPRYSGKSSVISKGIRSVICAPLLSMKELQGVLFIHSHRQDRAFTERDLELATAIALQAGIAYQSISFFRTQEAILMQAVSTLLAAAQLSDPSAADRSRGVARAASAIASVMRLPLEENRRIQLSALLHTIGDLGKPENKDEPPIDAALRAEALLRENSQLSPLIPGIKHQNERVDGKGPAGLKGDAIPISARILAVAKEYQRALEKGDEPSPKQALVELKEGEKNGLDTKVLEALRIAFRKGTLEKPTEILGGL
ncbi:MAG: GAF domain-containing protein [Planctomycetota bacterium]|nr:GAF domain-containing protein [Planctomycetota bacterium]